MQVWQGIRIDRLFLLHNRRNHRTDNRLADHFSCLGLEQSSDRDVAMHTLQIGIVSQDLIGDVLSNPFIDVS